MLFTNREQHGMAHRRPPLSQKSSQALARKNPSVASNHASGIEALTSLARLLARVAASQAVSMRGYGASLSDESPAMAADTAHIGAKESRP